MQSEDISSQLWSGYIWLSDQTAPEVFSEAKKIDESLLANGANPFIAEAQLISADVKTSVSISNVDGQVKIAAHAIATPADCEDEPVSFLANRMEGVKRLCFVRRWQEQADDFCDGMKTLVPAALIFRGFDIPNWDKDSAEDAKAEAVTSENN